MSLAQHRDKYGEMTTAFKGPVWEQNMTMYQERWADIVPWALKDILPGEIKAASWWRQ